MLLGEQDLLFLLVVHGGVGRRKKSEEKRAQNAIKER